jgi:rfaE bifunctional protein nucleotidyltransferase chain/domain
MQIDKAVSIDELGELSARAHRAGHRIVLSHGIFDLLHPGHVDHLQQARRQGDILVVSVTSDREVRRGPGRPVFSDEMRMRSLAALEVVDHVVLSDHDSALPVIEALRPDIFVKGRDYADAAQYEGGKFAVERERVAELGGETKLLGGVLYSSTRLLNQHFDVVPPVARAFAADFGERWDEDAIRRIVESFSSLRVLVVGEPIIDEYVTCEVLGVTPKERIPSVRPLSVQRHWGGSYAVARHLATCCGSVKLAAIEGPQDAAVWAGAPDNDAARLVEREFVVDEGAQTITKQRYVVENKLRSELTKVFAVSRLPGPAAISERGRETFRELLVERMKDVDLVVVADYGHGLIDQATIDVLERHAPLLGLNCQTNSGNAGFNMITKYTRADAFTLDLNELTLAYGVKTDEPAPLLEQLRGHLGSKQGWLTLGANGALGCDPTGTSAIPALTLHVRDTLGAGDAFYAWAAVAALAGQPLEVASFLGSVAGALAANVTGNERAVLKDDVLRFASTALKV